MFSVDECRRLLKTEYRDSRGRLPLLPSMPENFARMDELYVRLKLLHTHKTSHKEEETILNSYKDLFTIEDTEGQQFKRILIRAGPGGGKTTTISKIAYDWSKSVSSELQIVKRNYTNSL